MGSVVLGLVVAFMLVCGQVLWKIGAGRGLHQSIWHTLLSTYLLGGLVVYGVATMLYIYLLARNPYSLVQSIVVPTSLVVAILVARFGFKESLSTLNIFGLGLMVVGIMLAVRR